MSSSISRLLLLVVTCVALYGCGTKGPLYIPEQQYPQPVATPAP